jgi:hypothetical protein
MIFYYFLGGAKDPPVLLVHWVGCLSILAKQWLIVCIKYNLNVMLPMGEVIGILLVGIRLIGILSLGL